MSSSLDSRIEHLAGLLREQLPSGRVVTGRSEISTLIRPWNAQATTRPSVVARCRTTADVQAAVRASRSSGVPLSVLGGGHYTAGSAIREGGLLVDLSDMRQVTVDGAEARVAGGGGGTSASSPSCGRA